MTEYTSVMICLLVFTVSVRGNMLSRSMNALCLSGLVLIVEECKEDEGCAEVGCNELIKNGSAIFIPIKCCK
jgi:hypothetical protein